VRRRGLTETDRAAWAHYARLVAPLPGVAPLEPPPARPATAPPAPAAPPMAHVAAPRPAAHRPAVLVVGDAPGGVDRATWTRFRGGKLPAVRTLDLHGRTAQRAYTALEHFLHGAVADGVRCVEVITGRGSGETGGVIRREFPLWMNLPHLRHLILGAAHPHALNPGSVRLLLKRSRTSSPSGRRRSDAP
jgi:DNA-nicking Smr family endonuclease